MLRSMTHTHCFEGTLVVAEKCARGVYGSVDQYKEIIPMKNSDVEMSRNGN